jgi:hypothetical protein
MNVNHYIGFDVHKKSISYCVKTADGTIVEEGMLRATHLALREWRRSGGSRGTARWKQPCSADGSRIYRSGYWAERSKHTRIWYAKARAYWMCRSRMS